MTQVLDDSGLLVNFYLTESSFLFSDHIYTVHHLNSLNMRLYHYYQHHFYRLTRNCLGQILHMRHENVYPQLALRHLVVVGLQPHLIPLYSVQYNYNHFHSDKYKNLILYCLILKLHYIDFPMQLLQHQVNCIYHQQQHQVSRKKKLYYYCNRQSYSSRRGSR